MNKLYYKLNGTTCNNYDTFIFIQDIVLCKIYRKATSLKVLEQRAAIEEEMKQMIGSLSPASPPSSTDTMSFSTTQQQEYHQYVSMPLLQNVVLPKKESEADNQSEEIVSITTPKQEKTKNKTTCGTSIQLPLGKDNLPELQLPIATDWTQDTFWAQFNSPWMQNWTAYSNILNF